jgi:hypothetical protein
VLVRYLGSQDVVLELYPAIRYIFLVLKFETRKDAATIRASDSLFDKGIVIGYLYFSPLDVL